MPYLNTFKAPPSLPEAPYHNNTPLEDYDLNWIYRSFPPLLETPGGVRLVPLIPSLHASRLYKLFSAHQETYQYLPYGPFPTYAAFLTKLEQNRRDENCLSFAVYDLSLEFSDDDDEHVKEDFELEGGKGLREERLAGIVGVKESNEKNRMTEIGNVHIAPPFQRTHISVHSLSLLLHWLLSPPSPSCPNSLGLRRVQWFANPLNQPSVKAALALGFTLEAEKIRWERTLPSGRGKIGLPLPEFLEGGRREKEMGRGEGRDSSLLCLDWEKWENRGREFVESRVKAKEVRRRNVRDVEGLALK
ncbi:GNAT family N-acetyltransferase [Sporobolomyces salmoneus]|uniref:GNAT family N-acetyltransferase n=1 Tax=Sporobolomyces salmoneus TaxID=183962 RepID=UPI0031759018